ncbi:MAG: NAD kinase [Bacteroidales bacterium]|nr:NAD kinase [Bacteroidales bacterium]
MDTPNNYKRVLLFGREFNKTFREPFKLLVKKIQSYQVECLIFEPFYKIIQSWFEEDQIVSFDGFFRHHGEIQAENTIMLSIGGDGTFLEAITLVRDLGIPVAGINSGRLGFLADISREDIPEAIDAIIRGDFEPEERALIRVESDQDLFGDFNFALNEITIHKRDDASMIKIHAWLNGSFLNTYWADGIIVATPTGSTAYSLSVGGPLVLPGTGNFILSPIAPHNLTVRPLVYQDGMTLKIRIEGRSGNVLVSADSRAVIIEDHIELIITRAPFTIITPQLHGYSFYQTLRNKLMWGVDKRN